MSRKQWRCFHCDQVFTSFKWAQEHFGVDQFNTPACKISHAEGHMIAYIRKLEAEIEEYRRESHDILLAAYSLDMDARSRERTAEERRRIGHHRYDQ